MSIADGQVVLAHDDQSGSAVGVDARLSISRIGARAYPPALAGLAPSIRLQLAQARLTVNDRAAVASITPPYHLPCDLGLLPGIVWRACGALTMLS